VFNCYCRGGEGEEYDEAEAGIEYFMQRHSAAFGGGGGGAANNSSSTQSSSNNLLSRNLNDSNAILTRRLVAEHMAELLESANNNLSGENAANLNHLMEWSPGSPNHRDESFAARNGLTPATLGLLLNNEAAYTAFLAAKLRKATSNKMSEIGGANTNDASHHHAKGIEGTDLVFSDSVPWNDEPTFLPIMPGLYLNSHRHDNEKQEVLNQISELEILDMLPIIATCQFALCIYYSRMVVLRLLESFQNKFAQMKRFPSLLLSSPTSKQTNNPTNSSAVSDFVLFEKELEIFMNSFNSISLLKFLKNTFVHTLTVNATSDKIFPFLSVPANTTDLVEKIPSFFPFTNYNRIQFNSLMRSIELSYYQDSFGSLLGESPSTDIIKVLENFIIFICCTSFVFTEKDSIFFSHVQQQQQQQHQATAENGSTENKEQSSTISSSLTSLQDRIFARVSGLTSPNHSSSSSAAYPPSHGLFSNNSNLGNLCNAFLSTLIESCLSSLERASTSKFDSFDWIAGSLEKNPQSSIHENFNKMMMDKNNDDSEGNNGFPQVLFSFWVLKLIISIAIQLKVYENHLFIYSSPVSSHSEPLSGVNSFEESLFFTKKSPFNKITTPESLTRLLKISSSSQNESLRYCLYELSSTLLSFVNTNVQFTLLKDGHYLSPLPVQSQKSSQKLLSVSALAQITAAEFYVSVAKEKRLLQGLNNRIKLEKMNEKLLFTRYTRSINYFLFQWYLLRKQLNLNTFSYIQEYKLYNLTPFHENLLYENNSNGSNGDGISGRYLKVTQTSSSSLTLAWSLTNFDGEINALLQGGGGRGGGRTNRHQREVRHLLRGHNLYITGLSYLGMETPMLVLSNIDYQGNFRVDDLESDTLYKITIRSDHPPTHDEDSEDSEEEDEDGEKEHNNLLEALNVIVATDCEATFGFQSDSLSSHIIISSVNPLTLKNVANKKWSTARANVRLSSGIHRWDVHIDRCVSKNIFIGVATREGRLDNYVGCDNYGWGFLANQAIWHGKAKLKNYGELFRTGDTVSVILDLENGTLSYCLNNIPLGIAVDGLVGPLYPAFSLYNENDQLTITQVRNVSENPTSFGTFTSENILDRMETLRSIMQFFSFSHHRTLDYYHIQTKNNFGLIGPNEGNSEERMEQMEAEMEEDERAQQLLLQENEQLMKQLTEGSTSAPMAGESTPQVINPAIIPKNKIKNELKQIQKQYSNLSVESREGKEDDDEGNNDEENEENEEGDEGEAELRRRIRFLNNPKLSNRDETSPDQDEGETDIVQDNNRIIPKKENPSASSSVASKEKTDNNNLQNQYNSKFVLFSDEILQEVYLRYQNWFSNIGIKTIYSNHSISAIQVSNDFVQLFTQKRCSLGDFLLIEKRLGKVIGYGSYKLWIRIETDGELISLTQDIFFSMLEKKLIEVIRKDDHSASTAALLESFLHPVSHSSPSSASSTSSNSLFDGHCSNYNRVSFITKTNTNSAQNRSSSSSSHHQLNHYHHNSSGGNHNPLSSTAMRSIDPQRLIALSEEVKALTTEELKLLLLDKYNLWNEELDRLLFVVLQVFQCQFRKKDCFEIHYLELYSYLLYFSQEILSYHERNEAERPFSRESETEQLFSRCYELFSNHSIDSIMIRILLFQTMNDLVVPLASFILPYSSNNGVSSLDEISQSSFHQQYPCFLSEAPINFLPASSMKYFRSFLFPATKEQLSLGLSFDFSRKSKETVKSFYQFYSSLTYASLLSPNYLHDKNNLNNANTTAGENMERTLLLLLGNNNGNELNDSLLTGKQQQLTKRATKFDPIDRLLKEKQDALLVSRTTSHSPLTILPSSSPNRDHNNTIDINSNNNNRLPLPSTLYSATLPPSFALLQRENTGKSLNSINTHENPSSMEQDTGNNNNNNNNNNQAHGQNEDNTKNAINSTHIEKEPNDAGNPLLNLPLMKDNQFVFYLEDSTEFFQIIQQISWEKGIPLSFLKQNKNWSLNTWIEVSFVGQLIKYFELLQTKFSQELLTNYSNSYKYLQNIFSLTANNNGSTAAATNSGGKKENNSASNNSSNNLNNRERKDISLWETCFRFHYQNTSLLYQSPSFVTASTNSSLSFSHQNNNNNSAVNKFKKILPFIVRPMPKTPALRILINSFKTGSSSQLSNNNSNNDSHSSYNPWNERLFIYLSLKEMNTLLISDYTLFQVFVQEACDQVCLYICLFFHCSVLKHIFFFPFLQIQEIINILFGRVLEEEQQGENNCYNNHNHNNNNSFSSLFHCEKEILTSFNVTEVSLVLQVFHALGILIGLGLRNGFCPIVQFPSLIYSILANEVSLESSAFFPHLLSSIVSKEQLQEKGREGEEDTKNKSSSLQEEYENYQKEMKVLSSLKVVHSIGLVVRFGIVSIFPEVCFLFTFPI
jgi:hypothetical protein